MSENEEELRWRLEVLKTKFDEGKIHIAEHLIDDFKKSLNAVHYGLDGKIDLKTVDGRVRSMALLANFMQNREDKKNKISLVDISNMYFELITKNFDFYKKEADKKGCNASQFADAVSKIPHFVSDMAPKIPEFIEALREFWEAVTDSSHFHIQDLSGSKAIYGGSLFPTYTKNIASAVGLYTDTIVLSDPFWSSRHIFEYGTQEEQVYYLIKHAINLLHYKELALAELASPIVLITPFKSSIDGQETDFLKRATEIDTLKHASVLYGRTFESMEALYRFSDVLDTPEKVAKELSQRNRLLFDMEWKGTTEEQIIRQLEGSWSKMFGGDDHAGKMVVNNCFGRLGQATDLLLKSRYLMGTPLIDAPTSWEYFNWKLEYNAALEADEITHMHMIKGLQSTSDIDAKWLGNIPPKALIEMRQQGAFEEIREVLANGVNEIAVTNPSKFFLSNYKIVSNIQDAFERHNAEIQELTSKKIKFAGYDIGSWVVTGAIELAAIATGTPTFGVAGFALNQVVDAPKLKEIPERYRTLKNAHNELKKSPMGLLFKHK